MNLHSSLVEKILKEMSVTPGHILSEQTGIARSDFSQLRRHRAVGMSVDKLLVVAESLGVKLVYSFEQCQPVPVGTKTKKPLFNLNSLNEGPAF